MHRTDLFAAVILYILLACLLWPGEGLARKTGPIKKPGPVCARYPLPESLRGKPFRFAGEIVPLNRPDVRSRIRNEVNFLLLDARSVLTSWLKDINRYAWIFDEVFSEENIPRDFVLFAPIVSGLDPRSSSRIGGKGWWSLDKPCQSKEGVSMSVDGWHDDRRNLDLSTRCFAVRIKEIRKEIESQSWLMAAAAYVSSAKKIKEYRSNWNTSDYWDLPITGNADELIVRWIALKIIFTHRKGFGIRMKPDSPLVFDHVTGLVLKKDLPVAEIARITKTSPKVILELNPRLDPSEGKLPAKVKGKRIPHFLAAPRGTGRDLVQSLKKGGYLKVKR